MTNEALKKLEGRVFATDLRIGIRESRKIFDKEEFVKAAKAIQESTKERDEDANSGNK